MPKPTSDEYLVVSHGGGSFNLKEVVEHVVRQHGAGWPILWSKEGSAWIYLPDHADGSRIGCVEVRERMMKAGVNIEPTFFKALGYDDCQRVAGIWPEVKRLCDMLREACQ